VDNKKPMTVSAGRFIVGTLVVRGVVKPDDAERATEIVDEELAVWLSIKEHNKEWPFSK
jgi:hypothetical protein